MIDTFIDIDKLEIYCEVMELDFNVAIIKKYDNKLQIINKVSECFITHPNILLNIANVPRYFLSYVDIPKCIILGNNVRDLGHGCFQNTSIEKLVMNKNIQNIGIGIFWGSKDINIYNFPEKVTYCNLLEIPNTVDINDLDNVLINETQNILNRLRE